MAILRINARSFILSILTLFSYYVVNKVILSENRIIILTFILIEFLAVFGFFSLLQSYILEDAQKKNLTIVQLKQRLITGLILFSSIFLLKRFDWIWIKDWGIDPVTFVFFAFLPAIIFLKISWRVTAVFALMLVYFMAFFSINKYENTAESMAVLVFLFLSTSVLQRIKNLKYEN